MINEAGISLWPEVLYAGKGTQSGMGRVPQEHCRGGKRRASAAQKQGMQIVALAALWLLSTDICTNQLQALPQ